MPFLTPKNAEYAALLALKNGQGPACLGLRFERGLTGGIVVARAHVPLGIWRFNDGAFLFSRPSSERAVAQVNSPDDVVSHTIALVSHLPAPENAPRAHA